MPYAARVVNNVVLQVFRDVRTVGEAIKKYPNIPPNEFRAIPDHVLPGYVKNGPNYDPPVVTPGPIVESPVVRALRAVAAEVGPAAVAAVEAELGPAP